ncbi:hypothetical protein [Chryseobacterium paridis]|uniref:Uncharacterized protein n=1 Tax=Chryseobacterium paridis TaxID=2800328 RepID=A0ABS1FU36_9FLAO|nr:hypothetical protein [Chryseobacterium paridis]MBK1895943.1 hypothetical protein [Chryseobacterium paridis]
MKRRIFKYKAVYYLAITVSLILFLISAFSIFSLFNDFSFFKLLITGFSIVVNSFAFVNLVEKYDKAILFLNLGLVVSTVFIGYYVLLIILNKGFYEMMSYSYFKFLIILIVTIIVVNKYKVQKKPDYNEIENIGEQEE